MINKIITKQAGSTIYKTAAFSILVLIAYFFLVKLAGFAHVAALRFLNIVIVFFALRHILISEKKEHNNKLEYLEGLMHGAFASLLIAAGFAAFIFFYLSYFDSALMEHIKDTQPFGDFLNPLSVSLIIFLEGLISGVVICFVILRHYSNKKDAI